MRVWPFTTSFLFAAALTCLSSAFAPAVEISLFCNPTQAGALRKAVADWERETGNAVVIHAMHESSSDALEYYTRRLEAGDAGIDVINLDSVWPAMIARHLIDLRTYLGGLEQEHLPDVIDGYTIDGRLVAMPLFVDVGVMYYRKDLLDKYTLPVPFTWNRLVECATKVVASERAAGNAEIWGLVFQGKAYEGLTCCALEWLYAHDAGTIVDTDGAVTINNPRAAAILTEVSGWIGLLVPPETLAFGEDESREMFREGRAVFMRNWPYAWPYFQDDGSAVKDRVGVMPVPKGTPNGNSPGVIGGWGLAASGYSRHREVAADLIYYLTGPMGQKKFCLLDNHIPSLTSLFYDPEIRKQIPMAIREFFTAAVPRPARSTGKLYGRVSEEFFTAVHAMLSGRTPVEKGLADLEETLNRLRRNGWN